ncbi:alpha-2A adrenergic receptor-like [Limulus polyphemus]|uniref:Alpha-2A adrenergic receptor-like n=1 Tax=Limulus polyphemus TaxID=6850 RepID=A0ABM1C3I2_LIMPO|nr:alpha-2A adrenergic receptor-like [Limulus polyphemus]
MEFFVNNTNISLFYFYENAVDYNLTEILNNLTTPNESQTVDSTETENTVWNGSPYPSGYSFLHIILTALFVTCIMVVIVVGNMLVCIAIATEKTLKTIQNWFIASLAVSDFLVGLIIMPFSLANELMGYWIFGTVWCDIHAALDVLLCTASINNLCLISLDRYWSVTHAVEYLKKRTPSRAMGMICFVWLLSALISLPPLVGWKKPDEPSIYPVCNVSEDIGYVLYSALGSFYVPAIVMVFVYIRIFIAARSRARRHVKKKQQPLELTTGPGRDKSTTTTATTTCTSLSQPSPPDKGSLEFKVNGSGSYHVKPTSRLTSTPQIIIETSAEAYGESDVEASEQLREECTPKVYETSSLENKSSSRNNGNTHAKVNTSETSPSQPESTIKSSLLSAPRLIRSFGSTLSLANFDREEDSYDAESGLKKGKGKKVTYLHQPLSRSHTASDTERQKRKIAKARERRATLILGIIMTSFILAWLPFFLIYVLAAICNSCHIENTWFAVAFWLGYCNSALNPIIYTIFNRDFRKAFRKILFK